MEEQTMIVGMDFGTTNSGMAVYDGTHLQLLPLDPSNANPRVARTALYLTNDQNFSIGRAAIDTYFKHNLGRPVRMERAWVGEINVAWGDQFKWIRDVYVWIDALAPGRLFLSIKTGLRTADYVGTVVGRFFYPLEDLIALYLYTARLRAERLLGREVRHIVLGRPVRFATNAEADKLAESRLIQAAFRAGYETVYLEYEPIAAAYHFERGIEAPQNVLVFDFGGGTLDFTVMRLGDGPRQQKVLAVGGLPVAGDAFDQKLVRARLPRHFGEGTFYGPPDRMRPVPGWIYEAFADWQTIMTLQTPDNMALLREIARTSHAPRQMAALMSMVSSHYSLRMFDTVELAKRMLSRRAETVIRLAGPHFEVNEPVSRTEFENLLLDDERAVEAQLDEVVRASGLRPDQIDAVVRTGGSSQIPLFQRLLDRKFGADKVRGIDVFSSVASGLGIIAHGIETGEISATAHVRPAGIDDYRAANGISEPVGSQPRVPRVDLELVKKRILVAEQNAAVESAHDAAAAIAIPGAAVPAIAKTGGDMALVLVSPDRGGGLIAVEADSALFAPRGLTPGHAVQWADVGAREPVKGRRLLAAGLDEPLLAVSSRYRFLLTTARQLLSYAEHGVTLAAVEHLPPEEEICAAVRWDDLKAGDRLILVSNRGHARRYQMAPLVSAIEGPNPFGLDHPLPGVPAAVLPAADDAVLWVTDEAGRALRVDTKTISVQGSHILNLATGERLVAGMIVRGSDQVVLLAADGHGKAGPNWWAPMADKPNLRGKALLGRRVVCDAALLPTGATLWAATHARLLPLRFEHAPLESQPTVKAYPLIQLAAGEESWALTAVA
jgi:hypothetical chaperone protein